MKDPRLVSLLESAVVIATDMKANRGPLDDPRPSALECLLRQALALEAPAPPLPRSGDCPACQMPRAKMEWHPVDNYNLCPRCSAPLR